MNGDELDELVENGIGHQKKVTIMSSKRSSALNDSCDMLVEKVCCEQFQRQSPISFFLHFLKRFLPIYDI